MNTDVKNNLRQSARIGMMYLGKRFADIIIFTSVFGAALFAVTLWLGKGIQTTQQGYTSIASAYQNAAIGVPQIKSDMIFLAASARATADVIEPPMFRCDTNGRCFYVNDALVRLFGGSKHDFTGEDWIQFVSAHDQDRVLSQWARAVKSSSVFRISYGLDNGKRVDVRAYPARDPISNQLLFWNGTVTEIKLRETASINEGEGYE